MKKGNEFPYWIEFEDWDNADEDHSGFILDAPKRGPMHRKQRLRFKEFFPNAKHAGPKKDSRRTHRDDYSYWEV